MRNALIVIAAAVFVACGGSQTLIRLPGAMPQGTTTQLRLHRASGSYQVLYRFDKPDGWRPGSLLNVNGTLYGTTFSGGNMNGGVKGDGCGTVFSISTQGAEKLLFAFSCYDGHNPVDGLTEVKGVLYGATTHYAGSDDGTVYSITPSGTEARLYTFRGMPDGASPSSPLVNVRGMLYGLTVHGGQRAPSCDRAGCGIAYSIDTSGNEKVLYKFQGGADGTYPDGLVYAHGMLYGTTSGGGDGYGTFFSLSLSGIHTVLYRFGGGSDGAAPVGQPIDVDGAFYGTTNFDGSGGGTVYSMTTSGAEKVLYSFGGSGDGSNPFAGLTNVKGLLYGTTYTGGDSACSGIFAGCGTVYTVTTSGVESVLYRFVGGSDGSWPRGSLIYVKGTLYGTTTTGGRGDGPGRKGALCCGTVFAIRP